MKICFVTTGDIKNIATSKRALGMANPLSQLGYKVSILMEDTPENRNRVKMECNHSVDVFYFKNSSALQEIKQKRQVLKMVNPDFIYICAFVTRNIPFFFRSKAKVLTEHSELQSGIPDIKGIKRLFVLFMEYYSVVKSNGLLQASKYLDETYQRRTKKLFLKRPSLYFPYAFNQDLLKPVDQYNLPENFQEYSNSFNFVYMGTITRNYGIFTMLEAFKELAKNAKNTKLIVLGKGRHYNEAIEFVKEHGLEDIVDMPGFVEENDIPYYFSIASAFISPMNDTVQDKARCPSKLYMYLPFQKPVISCKIGETFETLKQQGHYYPPGDTKALATKMAELYSEKHPKVFTQFEKHSWETRTKEFDQWIQKIFAQ